MYEFDDNYGENGVDYNDHYWVDEDFNKFKPDPYYYHRKLEGIKVTHVTGNAYRVVIDGDKFWIPKKICKDVHIDGNNTANMWVHDKTLLSIMGDEDED